MLPGEVFVVENAVQQPGVQDPDPAVGQLTDSLAMSLVPGAQLVVVGTRPRRGVERTEGPLVQRICQAPVACRRASTARLFPEARVTGEVAA